MLKEYSPITVHGLVCHDHVDMAFASYSSLLKFSLDPLQLIIHDDGSLTDEDRQKLSSLAGASILSRVEADDLMNQHLKPYPNCYKYRCEHVYGLKLLDIALLSETDFAYCDSDILFLRPFQGMFCWPDESTSAIFMRDYLDAYSMLPWHLLGTDKPKLTSKVNAGLIFFRKSAYDLDFIEWFLAQEQFRYKVGWLEQTCWAALGHRVGCRQWNPEQVMLMRSDSSFTDNLVAGHFVKEVRYRFGEFLTLTDKQQLPSKPLTVETIVPPNCNLLELGGVHLMRQLKRIRNYHKIPEMLRQKFLRSYAKAT